MAVHFTERQAVGTCEILGQRTDSGKTQQTREDVNRLKSVARLDIGRCLIIGR
jgi:hypothetical protein